MVWPLDLNHSGRKKAVEIGIYINKIHRLLEIERICREYLSNKMEENIHFLREQSSKSKKILDTIICLIIII